MPNITVIIPLYNKAKYIARALDSVLNQTYTDYEIVVVDDGSTDTSAEIVKTYTDPRLRLIRQSNQGPGAARNKAVTKSTSPFLAFLDADDEWMPTFLEKSINALKANTNCDLTACSYFLGKDKRDITELFQQNGITPGPWQITDSSTLAEIRKAHCVFNMGMILCKRSIVTRYGGFYTKNGCTYGEDSYLWLQVMFNNSIYRILEPLTWYHSETSQLGPGRTGDYPLEAFLTDPEPIRKRCQPNNRKLLNLWLSRTALSRAHQYAAIADKRRATILLKSFPQMKRWPWQYAKLIAKLLMPSAIPFIRKIKELPAASLLPTRKLQ